MPEKSTMGPLFCVRQLLEKYREKNKKLCMVFIDLENAYDSVKRRFKVNINEKRGTKIVYKFDSGYV